MLGGSEELRRAFTATFGHLYSDADRDAFLDQAFGPTGLPVEIRDAEQLVGVAVVSDAGEQAES